MNKSKVEATEDRRRFFRIDDEVNLFYKVVDEPTVNAASQLSNDLLSNCSLVSALDVLDQESRIIMYRLEKNEPELAEYLKIMDSKISLIAQAVMRNDGDVSESASRNANISASGLAFECENKINAGAYIEIKLLLTSCLAVIVIYGKVIYCNNNDKSEESMPYVVGVDYVNLKEQDREILIKHVVKRQMQQIRDNKQS